MVTGAPAGASGRAGRAAHSAQEEERNTTANMWTRCAASAA